LIGCVLCGVCVAGWLVRCVCLRRWDGTGRRLGVLFECVDGAADIGIVDGGVCSGYAAPIRTWRFAARCLGACGAAMAVEGAPMRLGMGCGWCAGGEGLRDGAVRGWVMVRTDPGLADRGTDRDRSGCARWGGQAARHGPDAARAAAACDWAVCGRAGSGSGAVRRVGGWCGGLGRWDGRGSGGAGPTEPARGGTVGRGMGSDRRRWVSVRLIGCVCVGVCVAAWWCGACAAAAGRDWSATWCAVWTRRLCGGHWNRGRWCVQDVRGPHPTWRFAARCLGGLRGSLGQWRGGDAASGWAVSAVRDRVGLCGDRRMLCERRGCGLLLCVVGWAANGRVGRPWTHSWLERRDVRGG
jgi:hypothetical protein